MNVVVQQMTNETEFRKTLPEISTSIWGKYLCKKHRELHAALKELDSVLEREEVARSEDGGEIRSQPTALSAPNDMRVSSLVLNLEFVEKLSM